MEDDIDKLLRKIKESIKKYKIIFFCLIGLISVITIYRYIKNDQDIINISNTYKKETSSINNYENKEEKKLQEKIVIHIDGQVVNKGVYTIDSNYRLNDLINLAGGLTEIADKSKINLAKKLTDGEKIYIYAIGEEIVENESKQDNNSFNNGKVNINTAEKDKLLTLPGIGDSTADKIIKYRDENGKFEKIEDIKNINGIGEAKFKNIEQLICI